MEKTVHIVVWIEGNRVQIGGVFESEFEAADRRDYVREELLEGEATHTSLESLRVATLNIIPAD